MTCHSAIAAVLSEPRGAVEIRSMAVPDPGPEQALVKMEACGICHSDLFVASQEKLPLVPLILGHEGIGRVEAIGAAVSGFRVGDRVGITFLASTCGRCELCLAGLERFCASQRNSGYTVNGALANYAVVPSQNLITIPEGLPPEQAAPLCCAGWTAYGALREAGLQTGQTVGLFGMGGLGHLAVQYARQKGLRVAAVDISSQKLEMARELGAEITVHADNAGRTLQKEHGGMDAAVVLTASSAAIQQAFRSLKRKGTLILVGLSAQRYELPATEAILKGITIRGSFLGSSNDLEEVLRLAEQGMVRSHAEAHEISETPHLLDKMERGELLGRAVIVF